MSVLKLSHTSKEMYLLSPRKFYYHYYLNLREKTMGSPLFFGSLIENGLEALFKGDSLEQAIEVFRDKFKTTNYNGDTLNLSNSPWVRYSKSDYDGDIFSDAELKQLEGKTDQYKSWASLQKKGEMLIAAYSTDIMPKIKKVIATQVPFSIKNDCGDEITGFLDLICEWEDGRIVILDHKTSSQSAKDITKNESYLKQVALYYEAVKDKYKVDAVGFIVLEKKMRKKDPRARVDFVFVEVTEELIEETFNEFEDVLDGIKQGNFPCAAPKCDAYGQQCCYKKYCQSGGKDLTGLVKVGKK
jgi:hypothetical protein